MLRCGRLAASLSTLVKPVAAPTLLILQVGTPPDDIRAETGDLPQWFEAAIGKGGGTGEGAAKITVVRVFEGEPLPAPGAHSAAIITGSWAMVTDLLPWSEATAQWIRDAMAQGVALFGVCYGHQLMAHALGGAVDYHPQGREIGCLDIELLPGADADPLLAGAAPHFKAQLTHMQTVTQLPPGATVLARSAHDAHQIVRYSPRAVSTQFHPEITPHIASTYIRLREGSLQEEGLDPQAMLAALEGTPTAQRMLQRFVAGLAA